MLDRAEGRTPPTCTRTTQLIAAGAHGALVPSFASGATREMRNLVLRRWSGEQRKVVARDKGESWGEAATE